jgi:type I restriction enzyme R subunit
MITLFKAQGCAYVRGDSIYRQFEDILLEADLRSNIASKYDAEALTENETQKIISRLRLIPAAPLYDSNREAFWLMTCSLKK